MAGIDDMNKPPTIGQAGDIVRIDLVAAQDTLNRIDSILRQTNKGSKKSIFRIFAFYGNRKMLEQSPDLTELKRQLAELSNEQLKIVFEKVSETVNNQKRDLARLQGQVSADQLNILDSSTVPLEKGDIASTVQTIQNTQYSLDAILYLSQIYTAICDEVSRRHAEKNSANIFGEHFKVGDTCTLLQDEKDIEIIPAGTEVTLTSQNGSCWYCRGIVNGIQRPLLVFASNLKLKK